MHAMRNRRVRFILFLLLTIIPALSAYAQGPTPTEQIRQAAEEITSILDGCAKVPEKQEECKKQIMAVADKYFDWQEMAKRSLARTWQDRTPEEKKEFSRLFRELLRSTYIKRIESYGGEKVVFEGEQLQGKYAQVTSFIILPKENRRVPINYRMLNQGDKWLVYDVIIEGVSLVNNYRSQFANILQTSSYQELVSRIEKKIAEERAEPASKPADEGAPGTKSGADFIEPL